MTINEYTITFAMTVSVAWLASRAAIAIKYARKKTQAQGSVNRIFISFLSWTALAVLGVFLAWQFVRSAPLSRLDLLFILLAAFGLFFYFVTFWLHKIVVLLDRLSGIVEQQSKK